MGSHMYMFIKVLKIFQEFTKILIIFFSFISGCAFDTSLQEENNWFVMSLFKFIYGLHNLCWVIYDISKWMPLSVCRQDSYCQWQLIIDSDNSDQMLSDCQWQQFFSECCIE